MQLFLWSVFLNYLFDICRCSAQHNPASVIAVNKLGNNGAYTCSAYVGATVVQEVEKSFSNQKVASSIPCRSVLEQDTEPLISPDVQCAISVNVKCIHCKSHICK